jgi:hypothetical protein
MRALGYTEGRDFEMEYRWAEGYLERLPALAEDDIFRVIPPNEGAAFREMLEIGFDRP